MPSPEHEALLLLFRNRPSLAPHLLKHALGVELPEYTEVRLDSAELTDVVPTEYRADSVVVLLAKGQPVLGIVEEVQLSGVAQKRYSWPAYVANLRARLKCPCCLLVVTSSENVASAARQPIELGPGFRLTPLVLGPKGIPVVTDPEEAKQAPELAVLSIMAHGQGDPETAVKIALSAASAAEVLDEEERVLYSDLILASLSEAARKAFSMLPHNYEFQSPIYKEGLAEGKLEGLVEGKLEGLAEGKLEGKASMAADSVLAVLDARGLVVSNEFKQRLATCRDLEVLQHWLRRAVVVESAEELFAE